MIDLTKPARGRNPAHPEIAPAERQRVRWLLTNTRARAALARRLAELVWETMNRRERA